MTAVRKLLTPWRVLIAAVAICATAPPAKAELYLTITDQSAGGQRTTIDVNKTPSGKDTFDGYTFTYSVSSTQSATKDSISLTASLTANQDATAGNFKFTLFSSTAKDLASLPSSPTTGFFAPLGTTGTPLVLSTSLSTTQMSSTFGSVASTGSYRGFGTPGTVAGVQSETNSTLTATSSGDQSTSTMFQQAAGTTSFNLKNSTVEVNSSGKGTSVQFTSTTTIALPEPSGVAAAMAGLPCLGLLVGFVRRRRPAVDPTAAA